MEKTLDLSVNHLILNGPLLVAMQINLTLKTIQLGFIKSVQSMHAHFESYTTS